MGLDIEISSFDYQLAIQAVQRLLDEIGTNSNDAEVEVTNVPDAVEFVDAVWDALR